MGCRPVHAWDEQNLGHASSGDGDTAREMHWAIAKHLLIGYQHVWYGTLCISVTAIERSTQSAMRNSCTLHTL